MRSIFWRMSLVLGVVLCWSVSVQAVIGFSTAFSDHMVLQRQMNVPIWGTGEPGETITVSFAGQVKATTVDGSGDWRVDLEPLEASATPQVMTVEGSVSPTVTITDILVGEVWVVVGQSNIAGGSVGSDTPLVRLSQRNSVWKVALAGEGFSNMGFNFGKNLMNALNVPVGLLESSWGSTAIASFIPPNGNRWKNDISMKVPMAVRGCVYWQGESDVANRAYEYRELMAELIEKYREEFECPEMAFGITQLAPVVGYGKGWQPDLREGQMQCAQFFDNTYLCCHSDWPPTMFGQRMSDVHPSSKGLVAGRMADWALATIYDQGGVYCGPVYKSHEVKDNTIEISFHHVHGGLTTSDGEAPTFFEIAGADKTFYQAAAQIVGDKVILSSDNVGEPVSARFAWRDNATPNLTNVEGLPAISFRLDDWELNDEGRLGYHIPYCTGVTPGKPDSDMVDDDAVTAFGNTKITVSFNNPMDVSSVTSNIEITDESGSPISGSWSNDGYHFTFTPGSALPAGRVVVEIPTNVKDSNNQDIIGRTFYFDVVANAGPVIDAGSIASGGVDEAVEGAAYLSGQPQVTTQGDPGPTWSLESGPAGASVDPVTGVVTWSNPTAAQSPASVTIRATNAWGFDEASWTVNVAGSAAPLIDSTVVANETTITGYEYRGGRPEMVSEGVPHPTWTLVSGPVGMTIDSYTGIVKWDSPSTAGSPYTVTIQAANGAGSDTISWELSVSDSTASFNLGIFVSTTGSDATGDGSPARPYATLKKAGEMLMYQPIQGYSTIRPYVKDVYVSEGVYSIAATERIYFWLSCKFRGGYAADWSARDYHTYETILEGGNNDRSSPMMKKGDEHSGVLIEGFAFQNFKSTSARLVASGLVRESLEFRHCTFRNNRLHDGIMQAGYTGAGTKDDPAGGGERFFNCRFLDNDCTGSTGIVSCNRGKIVMVNCIVANTTTSGWLGSAAINGSSGSDESIHVANCTFYNNAGQYGAISVSTRHAVRVDVANSIFVSDIDGQVMIDNNSAEGDDGDSYNKLSISNCLFDLNNGTPWLDGGTTESQNIILDGDPMFTSTNTADLNAFKLELQSDATNAGISSYKNLVIPATDIDGLGRVNEMDIGARECQFAGIPTAPVIDDTSVVDDTITEGYEYTSPQPRLLEGYPAPTWSLITAPTGVEIDAQTGVVYWAETVLSPTPYTITIAATNDSGSDTASWELDVHEFVPTAPVILQSSIPATEYVTEGHNYIGPEPAMITDGDPMHGWRLIDGPGGMDINGDTGEVFWINPVLRPTPYEIVIEAYNYAGSDQAAFSLVVEQETVTLDPGVFVSTLGSDSEGNGHVGHPYATIQKAIAERGGLNNIYVAGGRYLIGASEQISLATNLHIFGGFSNDFTRRDSETVLDGQNQNRGTPLINGPNANWGYIDGLTFEHFNSTSTQVICKSHGLDVNDCTFRSNQTADGLFWMPKNWYEQSFSNCRFFDNTASGNSGIFESDNHCDVMVRNSIFANNTGAKAGVVADNSHGTDYSFINCSFYNNTGGDSDICHIFGGGAGHEIIFVNCLFSNPTTTRRQIYHGEGGNHGTNLIIKNGLFDVPNGSTWGYKSGDVTLTAENNITSSAVVDFVTVNTGSPNALKIGDLSWAVGNALTNFSFTYDNNHPRFKDVNLVPEADLAGNVRDLGDGLYDIGAYEASSYVPGDLDASGYVDLTDVRELSGGWLESYGLEELFGLAGNWLNN